MKRIKDEIAVAKGYPSWDDMFDWRPQTIEYCKALVSDCADLADSGFTQNFNTVDHATHSTIRDLEKDILSNL